MVGYNYLNHKFLSRFNGNNKTHHGGNKYKGIPNNKNNKNKNKRIKTQKKKNKKTNLEQLHGTLNTSHNFLFDNPISCL